MTLFEDLRWRGLIHQATHDDLAQTLEKEPLTVYCGLDPTADSLHIGHLLPLLGLVRFQQAGHRPIALIGGGTGMIGDPSGKSQERQLLTPDVIERNVAGVEAQVRRLFDFRGENAAIVANNASWLGQLRLVTFLRDVGKHFAINTMLSRDSVKLRLEDREHGISFTEFTYQLLQAYDFLQLYDEYQCRLQIGGSDQWGNIVGGMDLTRRLREGATTFGLTFPLITKADGTKFGKTEEGAVWLDPNRTSPYKFYQFWINQSDSDVGPYLRKFTFLAHDEIEALERAVVEAPHERAAQRRLAEAMTELIHGAEALENAKRASKAMFGGELGGLDDATLEDVFSEMPSSTHPRGILGEKRFVLDVLTEAGVFASKGEGRRMVQNGGLYVNNQRVDTPEATLTEACLTSEHITVVRKGKKNYHLLRFE